MSEASIAIAKERLRVRGLQSLSSCVFIQGSLLDLASVEGRQKLGLPEDVVFDYIHSTGVLHHLSHPSAGLKALNSVLIDGGVMFLMVYGQHGRTGVYDLQDSVRALIDTVKNPGGCLEFVKAILSNLPLTHRLAQTTRNMAKADMYSEDAELYDIFCHSQDTAFSVEDIFEFIAEGGSGDLAMATWQDEIVYDPSTFYKYGNGTELFMDMFAKVEKGVKRFSLAEKLAGSVHAKHQFILTKEAGANFPTGTYLGRQWNPKLDESFASVVLCTSLEETIADFEKSQWGHAFEDGWKHSENSTCNFAFDVGSAGKGFELVEVLPCSVIRVLTLLDCKRTVEDVVREVARLEGLGPDHWWLRGGLAAIHEVAVGLFNAGMVVSLIDAGVDNSAIAGSSASSSEL